MTSGRITKVVYGFFGLGYLFIGAGSMLLPTGWLPKSVAGRFLHGETLSPFGEHLLQEFGTVVLATGLVFLLQASRKVPSRGFHWAMTFYFSLDALIHWIGPEGPIGSWSRGLVNSIPFGVMLLLGVLHWKSPSATQVAHEA